MKKTTIALAVAIASLATAAQAAPADGSVYFGLKAGWSDFYKVHDRNNPSITDGTDTSDSRVGGGAYLGYQANPYLAFEGGYDWLGKVKYKNNPNVSEFRAQGVSTVVKLSYPITEAFDIYKRLGAFIYHSNVKLPNGVKPGNTSVAPLFAGGLQYNFNEDVSARLDYQWVNKMKSGSDAPGDFRVNNGLLSLGVSYNFANLLSKQPVEPPPPPPPSEVVTETTRFTLQDDVLFEFAKSNLKESGKAKLDELVAQLSKLEPTDGRAVVIGHTDRIGSDAYNQKLSLERATSVMNYLVERGIPRNSISARGEGKSNPVTGTKCNGLKGANLKACLAPDRRVEIEITGSRQELNVISN